MKENVEVPSHLKSTINMIKSAYPSGIPSDDYFPLIRIMKDSGMSDRNVSEVLSILRGGKYVDYMYDVAHLAPNKSINKNTISSIINTLKNFGFDDWCDED